MSVAFTNLTDVTPNEFSRVVKEFDDAGASVVTLALMPNGDMHVMSPMIPIGPSIFFWKQA